MNRHSYSRSQETGAIRLLQPLSRAKEERMRVFGCQVLLVSVISLGAAAFAADLKVKVVDPQGAAVAGAQVSVVCLADTAFDHVDRSTAADGTAVLMTNGESQGCRIQVLAPGFAPEAVQVKVEVAKQTELTVNLRMATASETVVVTATRTLVLGEAAGADVESLSGAQL